MSYQRPQLWTGDATSHRPRLWLALALVACVQSAVLGWMVWERARLLQTGREVTLDVVPVDPRSLFRGDYVVLSYAISRLGNGLLADPPARGGTVYVTLAQDGEGRWAPVAAGQTPPEPEAGRVTLKGRLERAWQGAPGAQGTALVTYGIESYFVPEGRGRELERLVRDKRIAAVLAVDASGTAAIKGLAVDGRLVHEEPAL
jgi:uncharacterized membrane-anchored protein